MVIAGPNGASKSRLGPFYSPTKVFDGDLLALNLRRDNPTWKDSWVSGSVVTKLMEEKDAAILQQKSFAFETNFSTDLVLNLIKEFKEANFKICLIYFGLDSISESISRVMQRAAMGGHDVGTDVIEFNFNEGVKRVKDALPLFENITFVDGSSDFGEIVAFHNAEAHAHTVVGEPFTWFERHFKEAFDHLVMRKE